MSTLTRRLWISSLVVSALTVRARGQNPAKTQPRVAAAGAGDRANSSSTVRKNAPVRITYHLSYARGLAAAKFMREIGERVPDPGLTVKAAIDPVAPLDDKGVPTILNVNVIASKATQDALGRVLGLTLIQHTMSAQQFAALVFEADKAKKPIDLGGWAQVADKRPLKKVDYHLTPKVALAVERFLNAEAQVRIRLKAKLGTLTVDTTQDVHDALDGLFSQLELK
jgi:hypothetical protein